MSIVNVVMTKLETMTELAILKIVLGDHVEEEPLNMEYVCTTAEGIDSIILRK